jgi:hypothetical protein
MIYIAGLVVLLFLFLFFNELWKARGDREEIRNLLLALVFFGVVGWAVWYLMTHL